MLGLLTQGAERGPLRLIDVDIRDGFSTIVGLEDYTAIIALIWVGDTPVGYVRVPIRRGTCSARDTRAAVVDRLSWPLARLTLARPSDAQPADTTPARNGDRDPPSITVAVCTRGRPSHLQRCLEAVQGLDYPALEVIVVLSGPKQDAGRRLVQVRFPDFNCLVEERPGLSRARNLAIRQARGDVIAFTDDDCSPHPGWARALGRAFAEDECVMVVTGLVVPLELETLAQSLFERSGGFGRGFERHRYQVRSPGSSRDALHLGAGRFGTGANMAFRRSVFSSVGHFDTALGVGTPTRGGEDLDMFFRVLENGHALTYEPTAVVRHAHRRDYDALRAQLQGSGVGLYAYFTREARAHPKRSIAFARLGWRWFWKRHLSRMAKSFVRPGYLPRELIWAELSGSLRGPRAYLRASRAVDRARVEDSEALSEVVT